MIVEQNEYGMAEAGEYEATLESYEDLGERPDPFNPGELKHQIKLVWKLANAGEQWDWANVSLFAGSAKFPPSKLYEIASLLLRSNPPKRLNLDDLIGKSLCVSIKRDTDREGKSRAKIDGYFIHSAEKIRQMSERISKQPMAVNQGPITEDDIPF
jgi:hypothetical protein